MRSGSEAESSIADQECGGQKGQSERREPDASQPHVEGGEQEADDGHDEQDAAKSNVHARWSVHAPCRGLNLGQRA